MAQATQTVGRSYQSVKDNKGILKRAYDLHFRRQLPWAAVERELGLKIAGGMTAMNCAERYIDVTDDQSVKSEGREWRRKRKVALAARKKLRVPPSVSAQHSQVATAQSNDAGLLTMQQVDERIETRLRQFANSLAQSVKMIAG